MSSPKVSVLILTYNRAALLREALLSLLEQTYKDFEVVIADDASTDNTKEIVGWFKSKWPDTIYIKNEKNLGLILNRRAALNKIRGKYIAILDDDDEWLDPNKLKKQVEFLEKNPDYVAVGSNGIAQDNEGKRLYDWLNPETDREIRNLIFFRNPILATSSVFRFDIFNKVGGYATWFLGAEDYDLYFRLGQQGKFYNFQEKMVMRRVTPQTKKHRLGDIISILKFTKKYRGLYPNYWQGRFRYFLRYIYFKYLNWLGLENFLMKLRHKLGWRI